MESCRFWDHGLVWNRLNTPPWSRSQRASSTATCRSVPRLGAFWNDKQSSDTSTSTRTRTTPTQVDVSDFGQIFIGYLCSLQLQNLFNGQKAGDIVVLNRAVGRSSHSRTLRSTGHGHVGTNIPNRGGVFGRIIWSATLGVKSCPIQSPFMFWSDQTLYQQSKIKVQQLRTLGWI